MLKDNLKTLRKNKGLSQEELSIKLNVVRQTISKWESGLSVPDAEMLITISEIFETPVNKILGSLCDVLSHSRIFLVHGPLGSDECHDTTGTNLVQSSGKEVIVDQEIVLVILLIGDFELTERNITDSRVKEAVGKLRLFKSLRYCSQSAAQHNSTIKI